MAPQTSARARRPRRFHEAVEFVVRVFERGQFWGECTTGRTRACGECREARSGDAARRSARIGFQPAERPRCLLTAVHSTSCQRTARRAFRVAQLVVTANKSCGELRLIEPQLAATPRRCRSLSSIARTMQEAEDVAEIQRRWKRLNEERFAAEARLRELDAEAEEAGKPRDARREPPRRAPPPRRRRRRHSTLRRCRRSDRTPPASAAA